MSRDPHREARDLLGAYALDLLDDAERASATAHLDGCDECRRELDFIAPAASALALADPERVTAQPAPPPDLGDRVLSTIRAERPARRNGTRMLVAACAAALLVGVGAGVAGGYAAFAPDPEPQEHVAATVHDDRVDAEALLVPHTWGVEIRLTGEGFGAGETYRATLFDESGGAHPAGEFIGVGENPMVCNLNSSLLREDAAGFEITDESGDPVVTSSF
ncbi:zf-HC2 domain-containing protein [Nocardiopsis sp. HNM0947]|uniref:Zf-HC2 domain-containing protein n=1 Tax=Nocardiopsis coralli TaxID=2772213 RepID=A0ABR9PAG5_9ACTN|nr:zf-HC2 domain-containing protein [Nocardiopsis coralli]MBE3000836.1 zf-HC2 domain-containing protein [Nocardiopsis coralli]